MQRISVLAVFLFAAAGAWATIFGSVRGIVHDPQHRPVPDTTVVLKALNSEFTESTQTNSEGEFHFEAVPLGEYTVSISDATFVAQPQTIVVLSGTAPILHLELRLPSEKETVTVSAEEGQGETVTPSTLVDRLQIQETPGASRSNSLAMITEFVPGAYIHQRQSTADDPGDHLQPHTTFDLSLGTLPIAACCSTIASPSVARIFSKRAKSSSNCAIAFTIESPPLSRLSPGSAPLPVRQKPGSRHTLPPAKK